MILVRLLAWLRRHWPQTPLLVRGDSHCATPEVREGRAHRHLSACVVGLAGHPVWLRHAAPVLQAARHLPQQRTALAQAPPARPPARSRLEAECASAAASWLPPWRGILQAAVMAAGDTPRCGLTSLGAPTPPQTDEDSSCARGHGDNHIQAVQGDRHRDRTSATTCLAHARRLRLACAASVLPHALRTATRQQPPLAQAPPSTVIRTLFQVAAQVKQYKGRIRLHLPSSCPVKALLPRVTALLSRVPLPGVNAS
jgi:Transposase DDE domain group 1